MYRNEYDEKKKKKASNVAQQTFYNFAAASVMRKKWLVHGSEVYKKDVDMANFILLYKNGKICFSRALLSEYAGSEVRINDSTEK